MAIPATGRAGLAFAVLAPGKVEEGAKDAPRAAGRPFRLPRRTPRPVRATAGRPVVPGALGRLPQVLATPLRPSAGLEMGLVGAPPPVVPLDEAVNVPRRGPARRAAVVVRPAAGLVRRVTRPVAVAVVDVARLVAVLVLVFPTVTRAARRQVRDGLGLPGAPVVETSRLAETEVATKETRVARPTHAVGVGRLTHAKVVGVVTVLALGAPALVVAVVGEASATAVPPGTTGPATLAEVARRAVGLPVVAGEEEEAVRVAVTVGLRPVVLPVGGGVGTALEAAPFTVDATVEAVVRQTTLTTATDRAPPGVLVQAVTSRVALAPRDGEGRGAALGLVAVATLARTTDGLAVPALATAVAVAQA